ncbi:MAG: DUF2158 domain-containing protein [Pseudomonadota bacterium]
MALTKKSLSGEIAIGDVVTLQDRIALMTVEAVHAETFGPVIDCCWFDENDCLRFRRFPVHMIDIFPRPATERDIRVGMEVRLRSRGPVMTVSEITERDGRHYATCRWTGPTGRERRRLFPAVALVLTMIERFEGLSGEEI